MNRKSIAIAAREIRLYLRSPFVWLGVLVVGVVSTSLIQAQAPVPLDLLLTRGEYLIVPVTLLVASFVFTAGLAREERDGFDDLWHTLPVRSPAQYWGKLLGAFTVAAAFAVCLLVLVPMVWYVDGIDWTRSAYEATLLHIAQGMGVVLLATGLSAFLHSTVPKFQIRAVLGVSLIVFLILSPRLLPMPWGVFLAPYVAGGIPWSFSALFGVSPWERAVLWHWLFHIALSLTLVIAASVLYKRHRDPAAALALRTLMLVPFVAMTIISVYQYHTFWQEIQTSVTVEKEKDAVAQVDGPAYPAPIVSQYDISVDWTEPDRLRVRAGLQLELVAARPRTPLTLHHVWEVLAVEGAGILDWEREGNLLWVTVEEGWTHVNLTVEYAGNPFVWDFAGFIAVPAQFMLPSGGYLSPHMAWYPLPGIRTLHKMDPPRSGEPRIGGDVLLPQPASFRVVWHGPRETEVVSSLPQASRVGGDGTLTFAGYSDGVALFAGPWERTSLGTYTIVGASSLVHDAGPLLTLYQTLLSFYRELFDRPVGNETVVVVPTWLRHVYGVHRSSRSRTGPEGRWVLILPVLGNRPVLTEHQAAFVVERAAAWLQTGDPATLLESSAYLYDALEQSLWSGIHSHILFTRSPVVVGIVDFVRLKWIQHVQGEEVYKNVLADFAAREETRASNIRQSDAVLESLILLDETKGKATVRHVLGWAYDRLQEGDLDLDSFLQFVQDSQDL